MGRIVEKIEVYDDDGNLISIDTKTSTTNTVNVQDEPAIKWEPDDEEDPCADWPFCNCDKEECDREQWETELEDQLYPIKKALKPIGIAAACVVGAMILGKLIRGKHE